MAWIGGGKPDVSKCNPSTFTLTFVIEIVGIDVFHDCNEGWVDLGGGPVQGVRFQYQLAPGQNYTTDVAIWPHVAKVASSISSSWVRTWFYLQRRWLAFTISHVFPVRVEDYVSHVASITPSYGLGLSLGTKTDKDAVYLPKLAFGERRQFASVIEEEMSDSEYMCNLIWSLVESHIPATYLDLKFDVPHPVIDKRHQDAVIEYVQHIILNPVIKETVPSIQALSKTDAKGKQKKPLEASRSKYEFQLTGHDIVCGTGRIIRFRQDGERPPDCGEIFVLIASNYLPAPDDKPVMFINIGQLTDIPLKEFAKCNITDIYTKWTLDDKEYQSKPIRLNNRDNIDFDDHHAVPLPTDTASDILSRLLGDDYEIELRGIRTLNTNMNPSFFGYAKGDRDFPSTVVPKLENKDTDILIGIIKINVKELTHKANAFIRGDYSVYPLDVCVQELSRDRTCTNDLNGVRAPLIPDIIVPTAVILEAQMTVQVSIGVVGCKPHRYSKRYSRLFDVVKDTETIMTILSYIIQINEQIMETGVREDLLSGFALDTGDTALLYVEGPRDRQILHVWEMTADFFPKMKPMFSSSAKYNSRLYPEFPLCVMPFIILKMFVPLSILLACPPVYARPALPVLTRRAVLKFGRLLMCKRSSIPDSKEMPTTAELRSFRLELCVAPRPPPISTNIPNSTEKVRAIEGTADKSTQVPQKINWEITENNGKI